MFRDKRRREQMKDLENRDEPSAEVGERKEDNAIFFTAIRKAVDRALCRADRFIPEIAFYDFRWRSGPTSDIYTMFNQVIVKGVLECDGDRIFAEHFKDDIAENIISAVEEAIEEVRKHYKGYDGTWKIEENIRYIPTET